MSGNKRTISFAPSGAYYAKNSLGLDSVIEIPGIQTANSFIKDVVVSAIQKKKEQDEAQAGPYDEVIKTINGIVGAAGDIPAINEAVGKLAGLNHIWDSKIYGWSKISESAKALGAVWDKAAKQFIAPNAPAKSPPEKPAAPPAKEAPRPLAGANVAGAARNVATGTAPAGTSMPGSTAAMTEGKPTVETAPAAPVMYDEPESEGSSPIVDDGFHDDIPWDKPEDRNPALNRRPAGPLGEALQKLFREKEAARAANPELDIF
jgi:hypothetical protein